MKIFIDTSAFIALIIKNESSHAQIFKSFQQYKRKRAQFFTSTYVLDELYTRCIMIAGAHGASEAVASIRQTISSHELTLLDVDTEIFQKAEKIFLKFADHKISFTDATTYVLYKDFSLDSVFTLDSDFKKMGLA